jgi:hypothetical protein
VQLILGQLGLDFLSSVPGEVSPNFLTLTSISSAFQQQSAFGPPRAYDGRVMCV